MTFGTISMHARETLVVSPEDVPDSSDTVVYSYLSFRDPQVLLRLIKKLRRRGRITFRTARAFFIGVFCMECKDLLPIAD